MPLRKNIAAKGGQDNPLLNTSGDDQDIGSKQTRTTHKSPKSIKYIQILTPPFLTDVEPSSFPLKIDGEDYSWLLSERGKKYSEEMSKAADNCCADLWDVYVYNDFTGYGQFELMENAILAYRKAHTKATTRPVELFFLAEGIILYLGTDNGHWEMTDDGDRIFALKDLLAALFLETFIVLRKEGLLTPDSPIKNIGLIAALIVNWADGRRKTKIRRIVKICQDAGIDVSSGPEGFKENVDVAGFMAGKSRDDSDEDRDEEEYGDEDEDEDEDEDDEWEDESKWGEEEEADDQGSGFERQLNHYRSTIPVSRMGGQEWNLSKWTEAERKRYSYENDDGSVNTRRPLSMFDPRGPFIR